VFHGDLDVSSEQPTDDGYITPGQLCIGLHVHIDKSWIDHPFTFSSFKIKNLEQVATLQAMGLGRIRFSAAKSDCEPLPPEQAPPPPAAPHEDDPMVYLAKRARVQRLAEQQGRVVACEREFLSSTRAIKSISQNMFSRPQQARQEAAQLVQTIAASMLTDFEVAINLMKDKIGGDEVYNHALNVTLLSMMMAKELKAPPPAIQSLGMGALFHDAGKLDIPDRVVRKMEPLTKPEAALLQQHCAYGVETGRKLGLGPEVLSLIAQHHEHVDGSGYPKHLQGSEISLLARIVAITNTYDNLCNPANPARALTPHEALGTMYGQQRSQFDAVPLNTFIRCMGVYPPGTIVVLSNDCLGMVVSVNTARPLRPTVLIYDPAVPKDDAILVELEEEPDVAISRTMKPAQLPQPVFDYLQPRKRMSYYFDTEAPRRGK
jgi:putative nucleotidyltransferase with HDIG domain